MELQSPSDILQDPALFGREWAEDYDSIQSLNAPEVSAAVDRLTELAKSSSVLEVAAGTGRIAIPLAETGLDVTATDASDAMLQKLREKDAQGLVRTAVDVLPRISGRKQYGIICNLLNSIWVMPTVDEQRGFFRNVIKHLGRNGVLVVEMGVANPQTWVAPLDAEIGGVHMTRTSSWNPVTQKLLHRFTVTHSTGGVKETRDTVLRIIFPEELLLMAEIEGLRTDAVWSSWNSESFGADARNMIAVFSRIH